MKQSDKKEVGQRKYKDQLEKLGFKKNQKLMQLTTRMCDSKDIKQRTCLKSSANSERSESMPDEIPAAGKFDMTDYSFFITVKIFGQF